MTNISQQNSDDKHSKKLQAEIPSEIPRTLGFLITVIGVFFVVATLFSLLTIVVMQTAKGDGSLSDNDKYVLLLTITSLITALFAVFIGIKLIKRKNIGRILFNVFSLLVIAFAWGKYTVKQRMIAESYANMPVELAANAKSIEISDALMVFLLPVILLVVAQLLNMPRSKAALD